jgi:hypothetical protein
MITTARKHHRRASHQTATDVKTVVVSIYRHPWEWTADLELGQTYEIEIVLEHRPRRGTQPYHIVGVAGLSELESIQHQGRGGGKQHLRQSIWTALCRELKVDEAEIRGNSELKHLPFLD